MTKSDRRRKKHAQRRQEIADLPVTSTFTEEQLRLSARSGCRFCELISSIIQHVSPQQEWTETVQDAAACEYTICPRFGIHLTTRKNHATSREWIQLFSPAGWPIQLIGLLPSHFLGGKDRSVQRLISWLTSCDSEHQLCSRMNSKSEYPTRFLDISLIGTTTPGLVKVVETQREGTYRYVALSHRWTPQTQLVSARKGNLDTMKTGITVDELPDNFREAIRIARAIGIEYNWIDSLCIIQDSDDDWKRESSKMADVYQGAYLTIATAACSRQDEVYNDFCFVLEDHNDVISLIGARRHCDSGVAGMRPRGDSMHTFEQPELFTRGWVLQERLLSRRIVHCYKDELHFQCLEASHCECGGETKESPCFAYHNSRFALRRVHRIAMLGNIDTDKQALTTIWMKIVQKYSHLKLMKETDILPALGGCAKALSQSTGHHYAAGLWAEKLPHELLWSNNGRNIRRRARHRTAEWTAPTWSWASLGCGEGVDFIEKTGRSRTNFLCLSLKKVACQTDGAGFLKDKVALYGTKNSIIYQIGGDNTFGRVRSGYLEIDTSLLPYMLRRFCNPKEISSRAVRDSPFDLHHVRRNRDSSTALGRALCQTEEVALDTRGAELRLSLDYNLWDDLNFQRLPTCSRVCGLAPIFIFRLVQAQTRNQCADYFMMLTKLSQRTSTYQRIGILSLHGHTQSERDTWFDEVWSKDALPEEVITIE